MSLVNTVAAATKTATYTGTFAQVNQDDVNARIAALESRVTQLTNQLNSGSSSGLQRFTVDGINIMNHMYNEAMIFQDIFNAMDSNIISKVGNPSGWDANSYNQNPWNGRRILRIGGGVNSNGNGILVNIPQGYNVLWLRVLNDRWTTFRVSPYNQASKADFQDWTEIYAAGYRNLNEISPDGAGPDDKWNVHKWMPIPIRNNAETYQVYTAQNSDGWISGIAFGKNIWHHAVNSAVAYHWKLNPGVGEIYWNTHNWNNDQLAMFQEGTNSEVSVPVVVTGKDKIVYIVEHNNNWVGIMHGKVYVNGQEVERFRTTYLNPFATHNNSKQYDRYMATRVPASYMQQGDKFIRLKIDMTASNNRIHFREIGTHDYV